MDNVFEKYSDQHIMVTKVYKKASDANYVYADAAGTVKIPSADLTNLYHRGLVIVDGTKEYKPVCYDLNATTSVGTLTYVTADSTTATTAVLATLKSKEYSA